MPTPFTVDDNTLALFQCDLVPSGGEPPEVPRTTPDAGDVFENDPSYAPAELYWYRSGGPDVTSRSTPWGEFVDFTTWGDTQRIHASIQDWDYGWPFLDGANRDTWTVEALLYVDGGAYADQQTVFQLGGSDAQIPPSGPWEGLNRQIAVGLDKSTNKLHFTWDSGEGDEHALALDPPGGTDFDGGEWYYVAWVREGADFRVYVNGVAGQTSTGVPSSGGDSWGFLGAMYRYGDPSILGNFFGCLAGVRLSNKARTFPEIDAMWTVIEAARGEEPTPTRPVVIITS
jgi:hypothetical protein